MTGQLLLTEAEAADRLRLSQRTLRKARQDGRLHYVLIGRAVRYTLSDLESYIEALRRVEAACPQPHRSPAPKAARSARRGGVIVPFTVRNTAR